MSPKAQEKRCDGTGAVPGIQAHAQPGIEKDSAQILSSSSKRRAASPLAGRPARKEMKRLTSNSTVPSLLGGRGESKETAIDINALDELTTGMGDHHAHVVDVDLLPSSHPSMVGDHSPLPQNDSEDNCVVTGENVVAAESAAHTAPESISADTPQDPDTASDYLADTLTAYVSRTKTIDEADLLNRLEEEWSTNAILYRSKTAERYDLFNDAHIAWIHCRRILLSSRTDVPHLDKAQREALWIKLLHAHAHIVVSKFSFAEQPELPLYHIFARLLAELWCKDKLTVKECEVGLKAVNADIVVIVKRQDFERVQPRRTGIMVEVDVRTRDHVPLGVLEVAGC
jgi:hypothetical protein